MDENISKDKNDRLLILHKKISSIPKSTWKDLSLLSSIEELSFADLNSTFFASLDSIENSLTGVFTTNIHQTLFSQNLDPFKNLMPGKPAPDLNLPDSTGEIRSLKEFKNQIIYIDFWGTWCYPCILEMPHSLNLKDKYRDKPVTFLYVALESDSTQIEVWKQFIAGKGKISAKHLDSRPIPGVHLVAKNQFGNEHVKKYILNSAPTYALVDHRGNLVNARAPRPEQISTQIDSLLELMNKDKP